MGHQFDEIGVTVIYDIRAERVDCKLMMSPPAVMFLVNKTMPRPGTITWDPGFVEEQPGAEFLRKGIEVRIDDIVVQPAQISLWFDGAPGDERPDPANPWYVQFNCSYPVKSPPRKVSVIWVNRSAFPAIMKFNDEARALVGNTDVTPAISGIARVGNFGNDFVFSEAEPEYVWHAAPKEHAAAPAAPDVPQATARPRSSIAGFVLVIVGLLSFAIAMTRRTRRAVRWVLLLASIGSVAMGIVLYQPQSNQAAVATLDSKEAVERFTSLHQNIYRAFDYANENEIYDTLAQSVAGPALDTIYDNVYQSLILRDQGGAITTVKRVEMLDSALLPAEGHSELPQYRVRCHWRVAGMVAHWGHVHNRTNEYKAIYTLAWAKNGWKIVGVEVLSQERVGTSGVADAAAQPAPKTGAKTDPKPDEKTATAASATATSPAQSTPAANWPSFRGADGANFAKDEMAPIGWNTTSGQGVVWKTPVPLPGMSSPICWGSRIFLTGADGDQNRVFCFDAASGKLVWSSAVTIPTGPKPGAAKIFEDTTLAAPTPATDGSRLYSMFANGDLAAMSLDGKQVWAKNLGLPDNPYGHAASLALWRDRLLVQYDRADFDSKLLAFQADTGTELWVAKREVGASWASPIVVDVDGQPQIITCGRPWVIAYDPKDGSALWKAKCLAGDVTPSPIFAGGLVVVIVPGKKAMAIKPNGKGDVTETHLDWTIDEDIPDTSSPATDGRQVFVLPGVGTLQCLDAVTGNVKWTQDVGGEAYSTPTVARNAIVTAQRTGTIVMVENSDAHRELFRTELGEKIDTTPLLHGGRMYLRGVKHLFCVEAGGAAPNN
jgi:outer membrane protein assembly factor BamB